MNRLSAAVKTAAPKQRKKQQEVLNVASNYFLGHGYKGTSINAMARDSGISKESIYRYFRSKKDLFEAVVEKELRDYKTMLENLNVEFDTMTLDMSLRRAAETVLQGVSTERVLALRRLIFQETVQSPDVGRTYYEIGPQYAYRYLRRIFSAHRSESDFEPLKLAQYFVAMTLHNTMLKRDCGIAKPLSRSQIKSRAAGVTSDFLKAFFK